MRILTFNNHMECAISHCLLYGQRLGLEVYFALPDFQEKLFGYGDPSIFGHPHIDGMISFASPYLDSVVVSPVSFEQFMDVEFDFILITMPVLVQIGDWVMRHKPKVKLLAYSGNVGWDYPNHYAYIGSSTDTYLRHTGLKLLVHLELLPCFFEYQPVEEEFNRIIRSLNNFAAHRPYYDTLLEFEMLALTAGYTLLINGLDGRDGAYPGRTYREAAMQYKQMVASLHLKFREGYGLTLAHIAASGRQIFTDLGNYFGSTLGPLVQAWGVHVDAEDANHVFAQFQKHRTDDDERMRRQARWAQEFFNYEGDAERVKELLEKL